MLKSNCHTHTSYCDGSCTAEEMVLKAIELGFVSLGFSGHCPMKIENDWGMTEESLQQYVEEICALKEKYKNKLGILCGIELDSDMKFEKKYKFDYAIGSVHQIHKNGKFFSVDYTAQELERAVNELFEGNWNEMAKHYFDSLADFVIKEDVLIVGHFDLITKFNEACRKIDENDKAYQCYALEAVDRILKAKPDILFEVNTGAMFRCGNKNPYPAQFILEHIKSRNGRITVTSDAHKTQALDFAFGAAVEYCRKCGFEEVFYLTCDGIKNTKI